LLSGFTDEDDKEYSFFENKQKYFKFGSSPDPIKEIDVPPPDNDCDTDIEITTGKNKKLHSLSRKQVDIFELLSFERYTSWSWFQTDSNTRVAAFNEPHAGVKHANFSIDNTVAPTPISPLNLHVYTVELKLNPHPRITMLEFPVDGPCKGQDPNCSSTLIQR
jgi:hypothetical protein